MSLLEDLNVYNVRDLISLYSFQFSRISFLLHFSYVYSSSFCLISLSYFIYPLFYSLLFSSFLFFLWHIASLNPAIWTSCFFLSYFNWLHHSETVSLFVFKLDSLTFSYLLHFSPLLSSLYLLVKLFLLNFSCSNFLV